MEKLCGRCHNWLCHAQWPYHSLSCQFAHFSIANSEGGLDVPGAGVAGRVVPAAPEPPRRAARLTYMNNLRSRRRAPGSRPARRRALRPRGQAPAPAPAAGPATGRGRPAGPALRRWWQKTVDPLTAILVLAGLFAWAAIVASPHPSRTGVLAAAATCAAATAWQTALLPARVRAITRLRRHGQLADAQVISVRRIFFSASDINGEPGYSAKITVSFADASGRHHAGQYYTRLTEPARERLGQVVQIIYDPRCPARFRPASEHDGLARILIGGPAFIAVCLAVTAWLFFRAFR